MLQIIPFLTHFLFYNIYIYYHILIHNPIISKTKHKCTCTNTDTYIDLYIAGVSIPKRIQLSTYIPVEAYIPAISPLLPYQARSVERSPPRNANSSARTPTAVAVAPAFWGKAPMDIACVRWSSFCGKRARER